jgi:hypothetical protein
MLSAEPYDWNVVIAGAWNVAILTPDGIKKRILVDSPPNAPVRIEVAVDAPGYFRVINSDGIIVVPTSPSLQFLTERSNKESLRKASIYAIRALEDLDKTPVVAAGVNIKYRFAELQDHLIELMQAPLDDALSDASFLIKGKSLKRSLVVGSGFVNIDLKQDELLAGAFDMNFHLSSQQPDELKGWLRNIEQFFSTSEKLLSSLKIATDQALVEASAP